MDELWGAMQKHEKKYDDFYSLSFSKHIDCGTNCQS